MTAVRDAFKKAGVDTRPPTERLEEICINAMVRHAGDTEGVMLDIWSKTKVDHHLTLALLQSEWRRCASTLIYRTRERLSYMERQSEDKSAAVDKAIKVNNAWKIREQEQEKARKSEEQRAQAKADKEYRQYLKNWTEIAAAHVRVADKPFYDASVSEIRSGIVRHQHESRFLTQVIHGVPDDGRPIRFYRKADEMDELWKRSETA